jgi:hypothetical protein
MVSLGIQIKRGAVLSAQDKYIEAIQDGLNLGGYHAVWPPGKPVTLGAIGKMVGRAFDPRGHLQDFVDIEEDVADPQLDGLTYGHDRGIDVSIQVSGSPGAITQALTDVDLSVRLTFHDKDQVALRAVGVSYKLVRDTRRFAASILSAFASRCVEYGDAFVNGMIVAASGAAAVSASAGATIDLTGKGDVSLAYAATLASLKSEISIANSSNTSLAIPMTNGFVVAIRLVSLDRKGIFKVRPIVRDLTFADELDFPREYDLTFDDLPETSGG